MDVQLLQAIVVEDFVKEIREWRNQPDSNAAREEGKEGAPSRSSVFPHSLLSPAVSRRTEARLFSVTVGA